MAKINGRDVPNAVAWGQKPAHEEYAKGSLSPPTKTQSSECGACNGSGMMGSSYPPHTQPCICPLGKKAEYLGAEQRHNSEGE